MLSYFKKNKNNENSNLHLALVGVRQALALVQRLGDD
jgi:hypothetical protein